MKKFKSSRSAFGLVEVLLAICIISIIIVLKMPNSSISTADNKNAIMIKNIHNNLMNALGKAIIANGPFDLWIKDATTKEQISKKAIKNLTDNLNVTKTCDENQAGCITTTDSSKNWGNKSYKSVILPNGATLAFDNFNDSSFDIFVDVDGPDKGKNSKGYDLFQFRFANNVLYPDIVESDNFSGKYCTQKKGDICEYYTAWAVLNGNADYLKCPEELNWDTQKTCK